MPQLRPGTVKQIIVKKNPKNPSFYPQICHSLLNQISKIPLSDACFRLQVLCWKQAIHNYSNTEFWNKTIACGMLLKWLIEMPFLPSASYIALHY